MTILSEAAASLIVVKGADGPPPSSVGLGGISRLRRHQAPESSPSGAAELPPGAGQGSAWRPRRAATPQPDRTVCGATASCPRRL